MSIHFDAEKSRWRWQWEATVDGRRHRASKLLPEGWSQATARAFDKRETARAFARVTARRPVRSTVPLIAQAVQLYLDERAPQLADARNAAANLAHLYPWYDGRTLDQLGQVAREATAAMVRGLPRDDGAPSRPLKPATIRQRLATLRAAAVYALKHHQLGSHDWIASVAMPSVDNARRVYLKRAEVLRVARACPHRATRALILMAFATGGRPGEVHRAQPGDGYLAKRLKNGEYQHMPIPQRFRYLLRHWPMDYDYSVLSTHWRRARRACGLEHVHLHDLRHSTASALISGGSTLAEVQAVLNQKTVQSANRYAHLYDEKKREVLDRIWAKPAGRKSRTAKDEKVKPKAASG
jgi:integrase